MHPLALVKSSIVCRPDEGTTRIASFSAHEIQKSVKIPVIGVGRLDRPSVLKKALREGGKLAAVRPVLIADARFAKKHSRKGRRSREFRNF